MSERKYGFGVIGCGVISDTHLGGIQALSNAEIVAVCDTREAAAKAKAEQWGCAWYTDLAEMLQRDDIHVCNVVVPSGLHAKLGIQCCEAGKHVICTKPIDITLENIDALIAAAERNHVLVGATHQSRNYAVYRRLKDAIEAGRLGKVLYGDAIVPWFRSEEYYSDGWHGTKKLDGGGALINQSIHYIDLLLWMMGNPVQVCGFADNLGHTSIEVEDCANAVVKFESGAHGIIQGTTCTYKGHPQRLEIHGTQGNVIIAGDEMQLWEVEGDETEYHPGEGRHGGSSDPKMGMGTEAVQAHAEQIGDLLQAIEEGRQPTLNGQEARRAVELILAIYKASETGKVVRLPL
ncbi:MAG: Gfo/Idh/MocA family oxidoreductase [Armatimonadetes bacterium]|nr:Gfo/Idh/MocA family oxidoreductase [Armatimonadota bacterium]